MTQDKQRKYKPFCAPRWREIPEMMPLGSAQTIGAINDREQQWWDKTVAERKGSNLPYDHETLIGLLEQYRESYHQALMAELERKIANGEIKFRPEPKEEELYEEE